MDLDAIREQVAQLTDYFKNNYSRLSDEVKTAFATFLQDFSAWFSGQGAGATPPASPDIPDSARLLWELSGRSPTAFVKYIRQFPDPNLEKLLDSPQNIVNLMEALEREMPKSDRGSADGIPQSWLQSSNIYGYDYDRNSQKLKVRFQGGKVYEYDGVPQEIYKLLRNGAVAAKTKGKNQYGEWWPGKKPSLGATHNALLKKGGFAYRRVS